MKILGNILEDATFTFWWNTNAASGASITRATDGTIKVDRDDGTDCTGTAVTDVEDDPDTGIHRCTIDTSDNANFAAGHYYTVWVDGAVIDGETVNASLAQFSIGIFPPVNTAQIDGTSQRATDLAEIAQYLIANSAEPITDYVADDSLLAKMLASGGDISDYDDTTDSQEAIKDAVDTIQTVITAGFPTHKHADDEPDGGVIVTGTQQGDNDGDSTFADDGTYWQIAATTAVGGFGLNVYQVFTLGTEVKANLLRITAKETLSGVVLVWAYNNITTEWEQISDEITGISGSSDRVYEYILNSDHQRVSDGVVKIRYTSTEESNSKYLYLDQVLLGVVSVPTLTAAEIALAVAEQDVLDVRHGEVGEMLLGHVIKRAIALGTEVATEDSATSFTLADGIAADDAYNGMVIEVRDGSSGTRDIEVRRIVDWTSGRVVTVDKAFSFTPTVGDAVHIHNKYADTNVTHLDSSAIQQASGYIKISDGTGTGQIALASGKVDVSHLAGSAIQQASGYIKVSAGTGTGQLSLSSGVIKADLTQILTTALTETSGYLAAGFKKFFNVATPAFTVESVNQAADNNVILAHASYGLAKLVRSTTPANTLDVAATGEAGLDFNNIKDAATAHTLTNITVPVTTAITTKTGFKLASDGLDSISTTGPTNAATDFREMMVQLWRRFFKKATKTDALILTYADDGTTGVTSQAVSDDGVTETQGAATAP